MDNKGNNKSEKSTEKLISKIKQMQEENNENEIVKSEDQTQDDDPAKLFTTLIEVNKANTQASERLSNKFVKLFEDSNSNIEDLINLRDDLQKGFLEEQKKREEFILKIPSSITASLSNVSVSLLTNVESKLLIAKRMVVSGLAFLIITGFILAITIYGSSKFYQTSIKTRQEARLMIIKELAEDNKVVVDRANYSGLLNQNKAVLEWARKNPNDSKSLSVYLDGVNSNQK